jgi:lipopolysaccharide heptosyltransferase I
MRSVKPTVPLHEYPARRIAVIKPSALGDIVHSLPVLTAVRRRYPEAYIAWVVNRGYESLLRGHPDLDATLPFDRATSRTSLVDAWFNYLRFLRRLRGLHFDLVIDLQGLLRTGLMIWASVAPRRVGLSTAREGATRFYTDVVPVADFSAIHAVDRYWLVAEALGAGDGPKTFRVPITAADRQWAAAQLEGCPRPWLVLGVGSRWTTKRWPPEFFATLAQQAHSHFGGTFIFVGGLEEAPLAQATALRLRGPKRDLTGATSLPQLGAVLEQADVMVANDTGPLHLAAALGRPVVAPYTCTRLLLNGPYGAFADSVESRVWCQGSYLKRCDRLECMAELTPDRLWPPLKGILLQWESNRRRATSA